MNLDASTSALRISVRNLLRHRARTAMTLAAIAFGVAALVLSGGFIEDVFVQLRETTIESRLGHVQVSRAGFFAHGRQDPYAYLIADPAEVGSVLADDARVAAISSRLGFQGLLSNGRSDVPVVAEGVDVDDERRSAGQVTLIAGKRISVGDRFGALVGEGVANSMRLAPGDFFTLMANVPGGALNTLDFQVVGIFRTFSRDYDDRAVRVPITAARELLTVDGAHTVVILLRETAQTDAVSARLRSALEPLGYEVRTWLELDDYYPKTVALYERQFGFLQLIVLAVVMLGVANSVNMTAFERQGEFGTVRALGGRATDIFRMVVLENFLLGLAGAALGLAFAAVAGSLISAIGIPMPPPPNANSAYVARIQFVPSVMVNAALIGIGAALGSSVLAAIRVARTPIATALRENV